MSFGGSIGPSGAVFAYLVDLAPAGLVVRPWVGSLFDLVFLGLLLRPNRPPLGGMIAPFTGSFGR
jgi:hypothetical protein